MNRLPDRMLLFTSTLNLVLSLINSITLVLCVQNLMASEKRGKPRMSPAQEESTKFLHTMREMAYAMPVQAAAATQMMGQLGRQLEVGHRGNHNGPGVDLEYLKFAEFRKANPPSFRGAFNPDKANEWVKPMENASPSWIAQTTIR